MSTGNSRKSDIQSVQSQAPRRPYEAPKVVHEEYIEAVAVACDPAATPFLPVKNSDGQPNNQGGTCQTGFLNS